MELYQRIVEKLRRYGEVLSEVADPNPSSSDSSKSDKYIHDRDVEWLERSDFFVAEVTVPSLGVGYEVAKAQELGKPTLCLYRPDGERKLSSMIAGSDKVTVFNYSEVQELDSVLEHFLVKK